MADYVADKVREGLETHHSFIDYHRESVANGEPIVLEVLDLEDCGRKVVRALISTSESRKGEGWQDLWIKDSEDKIKAQTLSIKVLEELDDEQVMIVKRPGRDDSISGSLYGTFFTTKKMEQEAHDFKKQFGREKLKEVKSKEE